jgi:DNA gyrase inhibitor GyrI
MTKMKLIFIIITLLLVAGFMAWQIFGYKTPEPSYSIIKKDGNIELREYGSILVAQVKVKGERYQAINDGFRQLAGYIFGGNHAEKQIAMTAPVSQEPVKIQMTAPVIQQKIADEWIIRFVMPAHYTLNTIPKPDNKNIAILEIPARRYAVIRFSGRNTQENINTHEKLLEKYISDNRLKKNGEPSYAFYNPPWILPFLRRNEIMIAVD